MQSESTPPPYKKGWSRGQGLASVVLERTLSVHGVGLDRPKVKFYTKTCTTKFIGIIKKQILYKNNIKLCTLKVVRQFSPVNQ